MDQKLDQKVADKLLDLRKESLQELKNGKIRAHGKLWGMDVFSWINPDIELVASTIESFPFPVIWIGNKELFDWCSHHSPSVWSNIKTVIAIDHPGIYFTNKEYHKVSNVVGTQSTLDALEMMKALKQKGAVLLFTATGLEWERNQKMFNDFMDLHQII